MDGRIRALERRACEGDLEAQIQLALARRRSKPRERTSLVEGDLVTGPALAHALRAAFEATSCREIELLRGTSVCEKHYGRWIRALRDLMASRTRSWCWVERWLPLLGVAEPSEWSSLAELDPYIQPVIEPQVQSVKPVGSPVEVQLANHFYATLLELRRQRAASTGA
jgi:hypothetical protein